METTREAVTSIKRGDELVGIIYQRKVYLVELANEEQIADLISVTKQTNA